MHLETEADVTAPPAAVWAALVDVAGWPEWTASMTAVVRQDDGPLREGSRARIKQPGMPALVWEVSRFEAGRGFAWVAHSPGVVTTGGHWLTARPDGTTRLILELDQHGPLAWLVAVLTRARTRRYLRMEADGIKARGEQNATLTP